MTIRISENKGGRIKKERGSAMSESNGLLHSEFIFLTRPLFSQRFWTSSQNMKKKMRAEKKKRVLRYERPSHTSPSHLHYIQHPRLFFESSLLSVPCFSRSTAFSRDFVLSEELKMIRAISFWFKARISIPLSAGFGTLLLCNKMKYQYCGVLCVKSCALLSGTRYV